MEILGEFGGNEGKSGRRRKNNDFRIGEKVDGILRKFWRRSPSSFQKKLKENFWKIWRIFEENLEKIWLIFEEMWKKTF